MSSRKTTKDRNTVRIINVGSDIIPQYIDGLMKVLNKSQAPTILTFSNYSGARNIMENYVDGKTSVFDLEELDSLFNFNYNPDEISEDEMQIHNDLVKWSRFLPSHKRDAYLLSLVAKWSALKLCKLLKEAQYKAELLNPSAYIKAKDEYLCEEIDTNRTHAALVGLVNRLKAGKIYILPSYVAENIFGGNSYVISGYTGEKLSGIIAALISELLPAKKVRFTVLRDKAWYEVDPDHNGMYQQRFEHIPRITVSEALEFERFEAKIAEAVKTGVITEITNVTTGEVTSIVKKRSNVKDFPLAGTTGQICYKLTVNFSGACVLEEKTLDSLIRMYGAVIHFSYKNENRTVRIISTPEEFLDPIPFSETTTTRKAIERIIREHFSCHVSLSKCVFVHTVGQGLTPVAEKIVNSIKRGLTKREINIFYAEQSSPISISVVVGGTNLKEVLGVVHKTASNITRTHAG